MKGTKKTKNKKRKNKANSVSANLRAGRLGDSLHIWYHYYPGWNAQSCKSAIKISQKTKFFFCWLIIFNLVFYPIYPAIPALADISGSTPPIQTNGSAGTSTDQKKTDQKKTDQKKTSDSQDAVKVSSNQDAQDSTVQNQDKGSTSQDPTTKNTDVAKKDTSATTDNLAKTDVNTDTNQADNKTVSGQTGDDTGESQTAQDSSNKNISNDNEAQIDSSTVADAQTGDNIVGESKDSQDEPDGDTTTQNSIVPPDANADVADDPDVASADTVPADVNTAPNANTVSTDTTGASETASAGAPADVNVADTASANGTTQISSTNATTGTTTSPALTAAPTDLAAGTMTDTTSASVQNTDAATNPTVLTDPATAVGTTSIETTPATDTPDISVATDSATSSTDVVNTAGINITTGNGQLLMDQIKGNYSGNINLLNHFLSVLNNATGTNQGDLNVTNSNNSSVKNDVSVTASTGDNSTTNADITTGDAAASANVANYINQNIVGNNWLMAAVTVLGNWTGDLIVPGKGLIKVSDAGTYANVNVTNNNTADVVNDASASANTGENSVSGLGDIQTGDAQAQSKVTTVANTNITANNWFLLLINNMGAWNGLAYNWDGSGNTSVYDYDFASVPSASPHGTLNVTNNNTAKVDNKTSATADTGGNSVSGNGSIQTGNASAQSNVFNFVNSNIVGDNWLFGLVTVMGSWNGDVVFGYPDVAVTIDGGQSRTVAGDTLDYIVRYKNFGQADAKKVKLKADFPDDLKIVKASGSPQKSGHELVWDISNLKTDQEGSFDVIAKVSDSAKNKKLLVLNAAISAETTEKNLTNNSASSTTEVVSGDETDYSPSLKIKRSANSTNLKPGNVITHSIIVENSGDTPLFDITLTDKMIDSTGREISRFVQPIGNLDEGKKVLVQYALQVNNPGTDVSVSNVAQAQGKDSEKEEIKSKKASLLFSILGNVAYADTGGEIISKAQAVQPTDNGTVLGVQAEPINKSLPLWVWLLGVLAYLLMITWSFFSNKTKTKFFKSGG